MSDETYNGWTNRETWAVALHINNDQGWQESVHEALRDSDDLGEWLDTRDGMSDMTAARYAGEIIRESAEEWIDYLETRDTPEAAGDMRGILGDIGSLWRVNWDELGAAFLEDLDQVGDGR